MNLNPSITIVGDTCLAGNQIHAELRKEDGAWMCYVQIESLGIQGYLQSLTSQLPVGLSLVELIYLETWAYLQTCLMESIEEGEQND